MKRLNVYVISVLLFIGMLLTGLIALTLGRYTVSPWHVLQMIMPGVQPETLPWSPLEERVVQHVRLPRMLLAALIGAGLAIAGAALQSLFRNPLAEPQLLGVSSGAAFGGVLAFLFAGDGWPVVIGALLWGALALMAVFWLAGRSTRSSSTVLLVLAGVVISAVFASGVSLIKLLADPQNQLPAIVFWLMGSLAAADYRKLLLAAVCIGPCVLLLLGLRFHLLVLTLDEADARSLGVPVRYVRLLALVAVGIIAAASVAVCGIVGWVGLVVPHLVRMTLGHDYRVFLCHTLFGGAIYLIVVDTLARTISQMEIPLGVLTALLGAPLFAFLVRRLGKSLHG